MEPIEGVTECQLVKIVLGHNVVTKTVVFLSNLILYLHLNGIERLTSRTPFYTENIRNTKIYKFLQNVLQRTSDW